MSKDEVLDLYRKYYRADKTVSQMTESKNLEVSDAEAKVIQVERIETDSREKAEELLLQASEEKADFYLDRREKFPEQSDKASAGVGTGPERT